MLIAHFTDSHVLAPGQRQFLDNNAALGEIVASINSEGVAPDIVLASGDLTNDGTAAQYQQLVAILGSLDVTVWPLMGNHDDRDNMRAAFPAVPWTATDHASWAAAMPGVAVIGLDSTSPGVHGAVLDEVRLRWLDDELARADRPVLLALHHPPFITGVDSMDISGFVGLREFRAVVRRHEATIMRIVCGHFHRPVVTTVAGIAASVCLASSFHVELDLRAGVPQTVIRDPRGYQLHRISQGEMVTHTRYVGTGERPFVPVWE